MRPDIFNPLGFRLKYAEAVSNEPLLRRLPDTTAGSIIKKPLGGSDPLNLYDRRLSGFVSYPLGSSSPIYGISMSMPLWGETFYKLLDELAPIKNLEIPGVLADWRMPDETTERAQELRKLHGLDNQNITKGTPFIRDFFQAMREFEKHREAFMRAIDDPFYYADGIFTATVAMVLPKHALVPLLMWENDKDQRRLVLDPQDRPEDRAIYVESQKLAKIHRLKGYRSAKPDTLVGLLMGAYFDRELRTNDYLWPEQMVVGRRTQLIFAAQVGVLALMKERRESILNSEFVRAYENFAQETAKRAI